MIQQPELGKRIYLLRKEKGLTQEELVEKCNLSVRTLQRIESGEVTPRPNTVKLILDSLEVPFDETMKDKGLFLIWLEQNYGRYIDLFNLKTNMITKLSILTSVIFLIVFGASSIFNTTNAQNELELANNTADTIISENTRASEKFEIAGLFSGWNNDQELIGRDVSCLINDAILIKSPLIRLNKETREVRTPCYIGIIDNYKIKITNLKCQPTQRKVSHVSISGDKIIYKGELVFSKNESIKGAEIIVPRD